MRLWLSGVEQDVWLRLVGLGLVALAYTALTHQPLPKATTEVVRPASVQLAAYITPPTPKPLTAHYVAHAGGIYRGKVYTNSVAALDHSYDLGYRILEVDLNLTTDNEIVLLHDWGGTVENVYGISPGQRSLAAFLADTQASPYRVATLADLAAWSDRHPDAKLFLDTKLDIPVVLDRVAQAYPQFKQRAVAYINFVEDYDRVKQSGYQDVALLMPRWRYAPEVLLDFAKSRRPYGIAMQPETFTDQLPELAKTVPVFCWTINDRYRADSLLQNNVYGVITDTLVPPLPQTTQVTATTQPLGTAGLAALNSILSAIQ